MANKNYLTEAQPDDTFLSWHYTQYLPDEPMNTTSEDAREYGFKFYRLNRPARIDGRCEALNQPRPDEDGLAYIERRGQYRHVEDCKCSRDGWIESEPTEESDESKEKPRPTIEALLKYGRAWAGSNSSLKLTGARVHVNLIDDVNGKILWKTSCQSDAHPVRWQTFVKQVCEADERLLYEHDGHCMTISERPLSEKTTARAEKQERIKNAWKTGLDVWKSNETPPVHVWPGVKEGGFNLMPADPGAGKTTLALHAAICTALGIEFLGTADSNQFNRPFVEEGPRVMIRLGKETYSTTQGRKVVYIVAEDAWKSAASDIKAIMAHYQDHLDDAGLAKLETNFRLLIEGENADIPNLADEYEFEVFREHLKAFLHNDGRIAEQTLLVVDTMAGSFQLPDGRTMVDDSAVHRHVIEPMKALCKEFGLTVLVLCHTAKGASRNKNASKAEKASRAKNSGAFWAAARGTVYLETLRERGGGKNQLTKIIVAKDKGDEFDDLVVEIDSATRAVTVCFAPPDTERKTQAKAFIRWAEEQGTFTKKDVNAFLTPPDASPEEAMKDRAKAFLDHYERCGALTVERSERRGVSAQYTWHGFEKQVLAV